MKENDTLEGTAQQFKQSAVARHSTNTEPVQVFPPLPRVMLVTLIASMQPDFGGALQAALRGGARLIQLRTGEANTEQQRALAATTRSLCIQFGARWLWNGDEATARALGADGVHWPQRSIPATRAHSNDNFLHGASVHSVQAARQAVAAGADYAVFGAVWDTESHPGAEPAGLDALHEICASVRIPVFAIGGVTSRRAPLCRDAGAHGVAVMRAVWEAADVEVAAGSLITSMQ